MKPLPLLVLSGLIALSPAFAQTVSEQDIAPAGAACPATPAPKLNVGSPAPALKPAKWIKGEPVTTFDKDKTYLIECWATWCGPCVEAIPHINELHAKFKDKGLVVIGMNVTETNSEAIEAFVTKKGDDMNYRVAFDGGPTGDTALNWLTPSGAQGIPHSFVVRENKILWQGHPSALNEKNVAEMIAGTFTPPKPEEIAAEKEKHAQEIAPLAKKFEQLLKEKKTDEAAKLVDRMVELTVIFGPAQAEYVKGALTAEIERVKGEAKAADAPKAAGE